jgi:hypothetical protein
MRIGLIGRCDNGGLGIQTKYFLKHVKLEKLMCVLYGYPNYPEQFPQAVIVKQCPTNRQLDKFVKDIDVLLCIETPYNWHAFEIAKKRGIKTALFINYEFLKNPLPVEPDILLNHADWHMADLPRKCQVFNFPVDREVHKFRIRNKANVFLHIVGHGGFRGRNGTPEFLQAIPLVKNNVRFIIYSQIEVNKIDDRRIEWRCGECQEEAEMFQDADVLVSPRKFGGMSLPLNEAMSNGLAIIMTDMEPQNTFLPKDLLIPVKKREKATAFREIEVGVVEPQDIAKKIDAIAFQDISSYSKLSDAHAETISWKNADLIAVLERPLP